MNPVIDPIIDRYDPIDLDGLDRCARLLTRKDRKYLVDPDGLAAVLERLPVAPSALQVGADRWSGYRSTYFDTPALDSFRTTATRRRHRFKVRTRCYVDAGTSMIEVKTKDRRGRTVKHRHPVGTDTPLTVDGVRGVARATSPVARWADDLAPVLTTHYRRATLALADPVVRCTIDADYRAVDHLGRVTGLDHHLVVETKTDGPPSPIDRLLWRAGYRPVTFSKYATALAALDPDLPHNRWHRLLVDHFGRPHPARRSTASVSPSTRRLPTDQPTEALT